MIRIHLYFRTCCMCYGQKHSSVEWDLIFHFRSMSLTCLSSSWGLTDRTLRKSLVWNVFRWLQKVMAIRKSLFISIGAFVDSPSSPDVIFSVWSSLACFCVSSCGTWGPYMYVFHRACSIVLLLIFLLIECVYAWVHQSWFQVSSVFLFSVFPVMIYFALGICLLLVYAYYRQTINRNHSACLINTYGESSVMTVWTTEVHL